MEVFGKFWSIIIGFILIFICPIYMVEFRLKSLEDIQVINVTDRFLDRVKYTGYIDDNDLKNLYSNLAALGHFRELNLIHRKRVVRPVIKDEEVVDCREFYLEVYGDEIKEKLRKSTKYKFKIGDEICLIIKERQGLLNLFPSKTIEMGGMIENEYNKG